MFIIFIVMEEGSNERSVGCSICKSSGDSEKTLVRVTQKRLRTILHYAELREKSELVEDLQSKLNQETCEVLVHQKCRRDFTDAKRLRTEKSLVAPLTAKKVKRSGAFYWKRDCFIYGKLAVADGHPDRIDVQVVSTIPFRENLLQICHERNDAWSSEVEVRLHDCIYLVAADAIYHKSCHSKFTLHKSQPEKSKDGQHASGRPKDIGMLHALCGDEPHIEEEEEEKEKENKRLLCECVKCCE